MIPETGLLMVEYRGKNRFLPGGEKV